MKLATNYLYNFEKNNQVSSVFKTFQLFRTRFINFSISSGDASFFAIAVESAGPKTDKAYRIPSSNPISLLTRVDANNLVTNQNSLVGFLGV